MARRRAPRTCRATTTTDSRSDYLETEAGIATAQIVHRVSDSIRLDVQARYADYERDVRLTEPLITPVPPAGTPLDQISVYRYVFSGPSDEELLTTQALARIDLGEGRVRHALVTGLEWSSEESAPTFSFGNGVPGTSLLNPDPTQPFSGTLDRRIVADTQSDTLAVFALDTIKLNETWHVTLGARWDQFDSQYAADRFAGPPTPFNSGTTSGHEEYARVDEVASYRAAVVYKPVERASIYLAASTSFNPSAQSLSFLTTGRALGTENVFLDPEENESIELGMKMGMNDDRVSLSAALFEITKNNARVPDPANPGFNTLGGEQRMRGVSFDVTGMLTERLYLLAGYAYLDGEVVQGAAGAAVGRQDRQRAGELGQRLGELPRDEPLRPGIGRALRRRAVRAERDQRPPGTGLQHVRRHGAVCGVAVANGEGQRHEPDRRILFRAAAHVAHRAGGGPHGDFRRQRRLLNDADHDSRCSTAE